ncbi:MAG TPA: hypothetical protein VHW60_11705 [Caulobacteraceae bacterium]|jgi:hypothetical protein|nr:hypothetical protein [Caulobacteraceae bacterium]
MDKQSYALRAGRVGLAVAAMLTAGWLAGCGKMDDNALSATFDKSMHDSCVSTATGKGAPAAAAEAYCSCVVTQLDAVPISQRMTLSPTSDKITSAENVCNAQVSGSGTPPAATNDTTVVPPAPAPATNSGE